MSKRSLEGHSTTRPRLSQRTIAGYRRQILRSTSSNHLLREIEAVIDNNGFHVDSDTPSSFNFNARGAEVDRYGLFYA